MVQGSNVGALTSRLAPSRHSCGRQQSCHNVQRQASVSGRFGPRSIQLASESPLSFQLGLPAAAAGGISDAMDAAIHTNLPSPPHTGASGRPPCSPPYCRQTCLPPPSMRIPMSPPTSMHGKPWKLPCLGARYSLMGMARHAPHTVIPPWPGKLLEPSGTAVSGMACSWASPAVCAASLGSGAAWAPRGVLVAHLAEHKRGVNAIAVAAGGAFFVTASSDETCKVWDARRLEKDVAFRSKLTYASQVAVKP